MSKNNHSHLDMLKCLLRSLPKSKEKDDKKCSVAPALSDDELLIFIQHGENATKSALSLASLSGHHDDLVVEYAMYMALMSNSLIEKGREFAYSDNGIQLNPPALAEHMMQVARQVADGWHKKIAYYKG